MFVVVDYTTRYPEAVPLRSISAKRAAQAQIQLISQVAILKEILTDQGTSLMSRSVCKRYWLLGVKCRRTGVYHLQTDGMVERYHMTMLRKSV